MKTQTCASCRKKIHDEERTAFIQEEYVLLENNINTLACFTTTAVLMAMIRKGRTPEYIRKLFDELVMIYDTSNLFGKAIHMDDMMKKLEEDYGIDFSRINVHLEDQKSFIKDLKGMIR